MKVLVVGGAGYVGSPTTERLWAAGHDVTVLDLMSFGGELLLQLAGKPRFRMLRGDVRDAASLPAVVKGHDAVVLLAAIVGEPACNRNPDLAVATNLQGARNVLAAARAAGVERFVFSSTCSNYGTSDTVGFVAETGELKPISTYAQTKVQAEQDILSAAGGSFVPTVLRLSTAFGVSARMRFDLLVSDFTLAAMTERKLEIYGENFWRPFVHVRDIAMAIEKVLAADPKLVGGEVFNVGANDANVRKIDLAQAVARQVPGTEVKVVKGNNDPRSYRVDFTKISERLDFKPQWSIDLGIKELKEALEAKVWPNPKDARYSN